MSGMLERTQELDELKARIESSAAGDGGLVIVEGPAGIGKSRLLGQARELAEGLMRVLAARGGELETEFAFGVVRQLFEGELRANGSNCNLLQGPAASASAVFGSPTGNGEGASFATLHGLYWLVLELAEEEPLMLVVYDLHWCDRPSLLFLAYLARRVESQPVLLLLGLREAEPGTDSEGIVPDKLHVDQVAAIGPRAVSRTVLRRLARLSAEARSVARAVAVLGDAASLSAVAALAEVDDESLAVAGRALAAADILRAEPPLEFVHPLVRDAIYHELTPAERDLDHRRAAKLLCDSAAPSEQIAAQLLKTSPRGKQWVADLLWQAGRAAMAAGAADSSVAYLRRAWEEGATEGDRKGQLLFELGLAETHTTGAGAAEHLALACDQLTDPELRAFAVALLARTLIFTGDPDGAVETAARVAATLPEQLTDQRHALEALEHMAVFFGAGNPERLSRLRMHRKRRPPPGFGSSMLAAMASWEAVCTNGTADECAELALASLADEELLAADGALVPLAAMVALVITDRPEVTQVFNQALADAHRRGSLLAASSIHLWQDYSQLRSGDLTAAEESLSAAEREFLLWGHDHYSNTNSRSFLAASLVERGWLDEAKDWLDRVGHIRPRTHATSAYLTAKSTFLIARRQSEEAVTAADELAAHCRAVPDPARLWWRGLKAEALDQLGRNEEAIALAREEVTVTRKFGAPSSLGRSLRILGKLQRGEGIGTLRESVEVLSGSTARLEYAKVLAALGTALRLKRRPTEARQPLRQALELASACGADGLAKQIRSELYAAGARPRRNALKGVDALTPSERRVVALAASGRTNRQIAQELFVTPKTVELHLTNAYQKLEVRSRRQLDPALAETLASVAAQSTGHNPGPLGSLEGTLIVNTSRLEGVTIDAAARRVRVGAATRWQDVTPRLSELGLAGLHGSSPDVGISGYSLGGGIGWLARKHGMQTNAVSAFELVTAEGHHVRADAVREPELFWALRGGGGAFGVVTAIEFEVQAVRELYAGAMFFELDRAGEVFGAWAELLPSLPEEMTSWANIIHFPPLPEIPEPVRGRSFAIVMAAFLGSEHEGRNLLAPVRALGPVMDTFAMQPPVALSELAMDPADPLPYLTEHALTAPLPASVIEAIVEIAGEGSALALLQLRHMGGALARSEPGAGVRATLPGEICLFALGVVPEPEIAPTVRGQLDAIADLAAPFVAGHYANLVEEPADPSVFFDSASWERLREIKALYDPQDMFKANHPIPPADQH